MMLLFVWLKLSAVAGNSSVTRLIYKSCIGMSVFGNLRVVVIKIYIILLIFEFIM